MRMVRCYWASRWRLQNAEDEINIQKLHKASRYLKHLDDVAAWILSKSGKSGLIWEGEKSFFGFILKRQKSSLRGDNSSI